MFWAAPYTPQPHLYAALVAIVLYALTTLTLLPLINLNKVHTPTQKTSLIVTAVLMAGLPPTPLFFIKIWNLFIAFNYLTTPLIITLTVINLITSALYLSLIKRCWAGEYAPGTTTYYQPIHTYATNLFFLIIVVFPQTTL